MRVGRATRQHRHGRTWSLRWPIGRAPREDGAHQACRRRRRASPIDGCGWFNSPPLHYDMAPSNPRALGYCRHSLHQINIRVMARTPQLSALPLPRSSQTSQVQVLVGEFAVFDSRCCAGIHVNALCSLTCLILLHSFSRSRPTYLNDHTPYFLRTPQQLSSTCVPPLSLLLRSPPPLPRPRSPPLSLRECNNLGCTAFLCSCALCSELITVRDNSNELEARNAKKTFGKIAGGIFKTALHFLREDEPELMAREFVDEDLYARDFDEELYAREFDDEHLYAREMSELEARHSKALKTLGHVAGGIFKTALHFLREENPELYAREFVDEDLYAREMPELEARHSKALKTLGHVAGGIFKTALHFLREENPELYAREFDDGMLFERSMEIDELD